MYVCLYRMYVCARLALHTCVCVCVCRPCVYVMYVLCMHGKVAYSIRISVCESMFVTII